jgi:ATP-dependent exoDNAse (exonuclease V) beta subunit
VAVGGKDDEDGVAPPVELLLTSRRGWESGDPVDAPVGALSEAPPWRVAEAEMLAERVEELVRSGQARAGEVVVLLRAVGDLGVYERALQERGLPTLAAVGGFWGDQQVGDLVAYLRALANPLDEPALYGTLASPLAGCSREGLALLARAVGASAGGLWETLSRIEANVGEGEREDPLLRLLSAGDRELLVRFRERFETERRGAPRRTISRLIGRALDASGYREHVVGLDWGERRLANIHKLVRLAGRFEASEGRDLRGFLDYVAHQSAAGGEPDAPVAGGEPDAVRLMSIHAAKGLEFPVVCVADLGRAQNVGVPDLLLDVPWAAPPAGAASGERIGLRLVRLDGAQAVPCLDFEELCEERRRAQAEEEDRILYVAMTRARERLLLSAAVDFERWPEPRLGAPTISWLGPALAEELPAIVQEGASSELDLSVGARGQGRVRCRLNSPGSVRARLRPATPARTPQAHPNVLAESAADDGPAESARADQLSAFASSAHARRNAPAESGAGDQLEPLNQLETLSYTTLTELERCGYRYYLERVLGLEENRAAIGARLHEGANGVRGRFSDNGLGARTRGALVHRLLESRDFARFGAPSPEEVARAGRELGVRVGRREREEIARLVGVASTAGSATGRSRPSPAARAAAAESVRRELPFAFCLGSGEPLLAGVIDLLARESDGGVMVLDYKSDRVGAGEDLEALVENEYGVQRLVYALAVLRDGAQKVDVVHWFLERPHDWVSACFAAGERGALQERLMLRIERARERGFSVSTHPRRELCETCPGRGGLCSYTDAETLREPSLASVRAPEKRPRRAA